LLAAIILTKKHHDSNRTEQQSKQEKAAAGARERATSSTKNKGVYYLLQKDLGTQTSTKEFVEVQIKLRHGKPGIKVKKENQEKYT